MKATRTLRDTSAFMDMDPNEYSSKLQRGPGALAQQGEDRGLATEAWEPESALSHPHFTKLQNPSACTDNSSSRVRGRRSPGDCWPVRLAESASSRFRETLSEGGKVECN